MPQNSSIWLSEQHHYGQSGRLKLLGETTNTGGRMISHKIYLMTLLFACFCALCNFLWRFGEGSLKSLNRSNLRLFSSWILVLRDWFKAHRIAGIAKNEAAYACIQINYFSDRNNASLCWNSYRILTNKQGLTLYTNYFVFQRIFSLISLYVLSDYEIYIQNITLAVGRDEKKNHRPEEIQSL